MHEPQQLIDLGNVENDGTGDPLRDAFAKVNNNFANVWASGPVNTQVVIGNNRVTTNETNLDLVIAGNGIGNVTVATSVMPITDGILDLGSPTKSFDEVHALYYYGNGAFLTGISGGANTNYSNANVEAYLPTYTGNLVSLTGPVITTDNVSANNLQLDGTASVAGAVVANTVSAAGFAGNTVSVTGNITGANVNLSGNISIAGNVNSPLTVRANISATNVVTGGNLLAVHGNFVGNVSGDYFTGNGRFLTGVVATGSNAIAFGSSNVSIKDPSGNVTVGVAGVGNVAEFTSSGLNIAGNLVAGNIVGNVTGNLTVSGNTGDVLFNANGVVGTTDAFTFDSANTRLSVAGNVVAGAFVGDGRALANVVAARGTDSNNWNTLIQMGVYTVNRTSWSGTVGTPLDSQVFVGLLEVLNDNSTAITQIFYPGTVESGNEKIQWNRTYWSGTWSGWVKMVNDYQVVVGGEF